MKNFIHLGSSPLRLEGFAVSEDEKNRGIGRDKIGFLILRNKEALSFFVSLLNNISKGINSGKKVHSIKIKRYLSKSCSELKESIIDSLSHGITLDI